MECVQDAHSFMPSAFLRYSNQQQQRFRSWGVGVLGEEWSIRQTVWLLLFVGLAMSSYPLRLNSIDLGIGKHKAKNKAPKVLWGQLYHCACERDGGDLNDGDESMM